MALPASCPLCALPLGPFYIEAHGTEHLSGRFHVQCWAAAMEAMKFLGRLPAAHGSAGIAGTSAPR